jgi:hypothetical protein
MTWIVRGLIAVLVTSFVVSSTNAADWRFELRFTKDTSPLPYTGRVYVFTTEKKDAEPRMGPNWFGPEPICALDVTDWRPDDPLVISPSTPGLLAARRAARAGRDANGSVGTDRWHRRGK